ncbi:SOS response-associated peptidase family protein [Bifidobacterium sp. ESL0775]|uniref:SOS response-associated peptidase n=1 Tax=Bifidobacterium sp. ESL0775 TaxID=2983230 RepID=UPI0023F87645|nr:SOS response-associated peptidase family protein [Bifidobacterium sp. ESL0775]WEV68503.1 SOS response-associated peptidase family protein [Bifidobacterium sp. ESL0775]
MCSKFSLDLDWDAIGQDFGVGDDQISNDTLPSRTFLVKPKQNIGLIAQGRDGTRHLRGASWSLIPRVSATDNLDYPTYNSRIESAKWRPAYCDSLDHMRAIIPASGYFEPHQRRPFYFHAPDDHVLAMAGLYSWWRQTPSSPWKLTAAIMTCAATGGTEKIHKRMPLLISANLRDRWLDPHQDGVSILDAVHQSANKLAQRLEFHEVAPLSGDGPHIIEPLNKEKPASLF